MKNLTKEWVRKAEDDLVAVRRIRKGKPPLYDEICFHCQQAAEKYLKALLQELGVTVPRIHDLLVLLGLLLVHDATLKPLRPRMRILRRYAVDVRYPGFSANARQARGALRITEITRAEIRRRLGLRQLPRVTKRSK